jgi:two-component system, LytTR family, sensor kinase
MIPTGVYTGEHRPKLHALFWLMWITSFTLLQSMGQGSSSVLYWLMYYLITLPVFMIHTYLIAYWLVPHTFMQNRYFLFSMMLLLFLVIFSVTELVISVEVVDRLFYQGKLPPSGYLNFKNIIISGIGNHYIILVFMAVKAGRAWYRSQNRERDEQLINLDTGIEIYLYQLQPRMMHHLMKLLGKVIKSDPQKAPDMIIRLSGFLNRFLKEAAREQTTLSEELNLAGEYLGFYASATEGSQRIKCKSQGDFHLFKLPPFLFLPVLDAAVNSLNGSPGNCSVDAETSKDGFRLKIRIGNLQMANPGEYDDVDMLLSRLQRSFNCNFRLNDEIGEGYRQIDVEVFEGLCN